MGGDDLRCAVIEKQCVRATAVNGDDVVDGEAVRVVVMRLVVDVLAAEVAGGLVLGDDFAVSVAPCRGAWSQCRPQRFKANASHTLCVQMLAQNGSICCVLGGVGPLDVVVVSLA